MGDFDDDDGFDGFDFMRFMDDDYDRFLKPRQNIPKPEAVQTNLFYNLDEKLEKMKIKDIETDKLGYPTLKLTVTYSKDSIIADVDNIFIFGSSVKNIPKINRFPYFVCYMLLTEIEKSFQKIPDEVLLESINILNEIYKKKDITTLVEVESFKKYISSYRFFKNISYDFYFNALKKLCFFSETLFKEVLKEKLKTSPVKANLNTPIDGNTTDELMTIDTYISENMKTIRDILLFQTSDKYKISDVVGAFDK